MKINNSQLPGINSVFIPLYTLCRGIPVLDLNSENISLLYKHKDKKPNILMQRNLLEVIGSVFFTSGILASVFGYAKDFSKTLTIGIGAILTGGIAAAIGWFAKPSRSIREAISKLTQEEKQNKLKDDFIQSAFQGVKEQISFGYKDVSKSEKELNEWEEAYKEKIIFNSTFLIDKVNPERKNIIVYYPGFGYDFPNIISSTDATTIICSSLERKLGNHDCLEAVVSIIKKMGGEINTSETFIPEDQARGKAKIVFSLKDISGNVKNRTLIYYYGKEANAITFIPEEIKNGYDVLWVEAAPIFSNEENTNAEVIKLLKNNGLIVKGQLQSIEITKKNKLTIDCEKPISAVAEGVIPFEMWDPVLHGAGGYRVTIDGEYFQLHTKNKAELEALVNELKNEHEDKFSIPRSSVLEVERFPQEDFSEAINGYMHAWIMNDLKHFQELFPNRYAFLKYLFPQLKTEGRAELF